MEAYEIISKLSFKPYFIWLAPYTLIKGGSTTTFEPSGFKPYFRWLAPYTEVLKVKILEAIKHVLNLILSG